MTTERPILFSSPMIRAILAGRKTMTRRVVNHAASMTGNMMEGEEDSWCPYGGAGDRLWVRETWATVQELDKLAASSFKPFEDWRKPEILYAADTREKLNKWGKWRPSIFMPRWASRITLEITSVKVERVRDISEEDAEAEGIAFMRDIPDADETLSAKVLFEILWDSINSKRGYGWDANPWVWVVSFKKVTP